jgi:hypothetical protein
MKTLAFGTFIRINVINIISDRRILLISIHNSSVKQGKRPFYRSAIGNRPFHATFIDSVIGAFWFASATIDTFFSYLNSHNTGVKVVEVIFVAKLSQKNNPANDFEPTN